MKRKPWALIILSLLHIISPLGSLLVNAFNTGRTLSQQWHYWFVLLPKPLVFIYVGLPILAGALIYVCRRWSYWSYLAVIGIIFFSNVYSYSTNMTVGTLLLLIAVTLIDILIVAYFMVPSVQQVYFDPRMRWWEAAPRYHFDTEGIVNGGRAFLKNLSQGGMFMTSGPELAEGDKVDVYWSFQGEEVTVSGIVVYKAPASGALGYGVRFDHTVETKKKVDRVISQLHAEKRIVVERLPGPEESFISWFRKLLQTGEGLFPKVKKA